jgi:hypothetical protein
MAGAAAASKNYLAAGLFLFAFLLVASLAYQNILQQMETKENFDSAGSTTQAITQAAHCSCIPGYIPSKTAGGGNYVCVKLGDPSSIRSCY